LKFEVVETLRAQALDFELFEPCCWVRWSAFVEFVDRDLFELDVWVDNAVDFGWPR
jgi:hypothetical protein